LAEFRLDEAAKLCFEFVWRDLADWYVEAVKPRLGGSASFLSFPESGLTAQSVLAYCFDTVLRLLHPVVPFITEELWQKMPGRQPGDLLITATWPTADSRLEHPNHLEKFRIVPEAVNTVRSIRAEYRIPPGQVLGSLVLTPSSSESRQVLIDSGSTIQRLTKVAEVKVVEVGANEGAADNDNSVHFVLTDSSKGVLPLGSVVDKGRECGRLGNELARLDRALGALSNKLGDANFVSRAPADVVAREREKEQTWRAQRDVLAGKLSALGCS
jgi:valyl-tRNA synthetase